MHCPFVALSFLTCALGGLAVDVPKANGNAKQFCSSVDFYLTEFHEQAAATAFCSSFLHFSPVYTTSTVTSTKTTTSTASVSVTTTTSTTETTTSGTTVTTTVGSTVTNTNTATSIATTVVETSTTTNTATVTSLATAASTITTISTSISTTRLSYCTSPAVFSKRELHERRTRPAPTCFSNWYGASSLVSSACSCLSISQPTSSRIVSVSATTTVTMTSTASVTKSVTGTTTVTTTKTATATSSATASASVTVTVTSSITAVVSTDTTVTITSTTTTITTTQALAIATRYVDFAIMASYNQQFAETHAWSAGNSGDGIYFQETDVDLAATFSFSGTKLLYNGIYINEYQPSSGSYFAVVNRGDPEFGYHMDCNLQTEAFSGEGCVLDCYVGGSGLFVPAYGNDVDNFSGAWGQSGDTDRFTVYAVGQT